MKNDLKNISTAAAIYLGLLIIGTLFFFGDWFVSDKVPDLDHIVRTAGVIFYTIFIIYLSIHWFVRRQRK